MTTKIIGAGTSVHALPHLFFTFLPPAALTKKGPVASLSLGPEYALRWFTPGGEVDLCGHATLAAAFALWEEGRVDPSLPVRFSTASGVLTCRRDGEGWVAMDFPAEVGHFFGAWGGDFCSALSIGWVFTFVTPLHFLYPSGKGHARATKRSVATAAVTVRLSRPSTVLHGHTDTHTRHTHRPCL